MCHNICIVFIHYLLLFTPSHNMKICVHLYPSNLLRYWEWWSLSHEFIIYTVCHVFWKDCRLLMNGSLLIIILAWLQKLNTCVFKVFYNFYKHTLSQNTHIWKFDFCSIKWQMEILWCVFNFFYFESYGFLLTIAMKAVVLIFSLPHS